MNSGPEDLRCGSKKHAVLVGDILEVKCSSRFCGAGPGITVTHKFDLNTGKLLGTNKYKDPARGR